MRAESAAQRGVTITQRYACGGSHMMTVVGAARAGSRHFVEIYDPAGAGFFVWSLYAPGLLDEPEYVESRSHFEVVPQQPAVCTPKDGDAQGCLEPDFQADLEPLASVKRARAAGPLASGPDKDAEQARDAAECGMALVRALGSQHPASLNFASASEAKSATLNEDQAVRPVYLPAAGTCADPRSNCPTCHMFFYEVAGKGKGELIVAKHEGVWQVVKVAGDPDADLVLQTLRGTKKQAPLPPGPGPVVPPSLPNGPLGKTLKLRQLLIVPELRLRLLQVGTTQTQRPRFAPIGRIPGTEPTQTFTAADLRTYLERQFPSFKPKKVKVDDKTDIVPQPN
jgi:hypothetical protein